MEEKIENLKTINRYFSPISLRQNNTINNNMNSIKTKSYNSKYLYNSTTKRKEKKNLNTIETNN